MKGLSQNAFLDEQRQNFIKIFNEAIGSLVDLGLVEDAQIESLNTILSLVQMEIEASTAYDAAEQMKSEGKFFSSFSM